MVIICMTIMVMFVNSRYGRVIRAIRDNEIAAFTNGSILNSVFIVVTVVVGGMGSMTGSVISAIGMFLLNYTIKNGNWVNGLPDYLKNVFTYPMLVYSIALVIVILFRPKGIMGDKELSLYGILKMPGKIAAGLKKKCNEGGLIYGKYRKNSTPF